MKSSILRPKILILLLALYLISITMSKTKHPANMVLLRWFPTLFNKIEKYIVEIKYLNYNYSLK